MSDYQTGEQPLPAGGSCNLCSINISEYVKNPFTENRYFDFEELANDIPYIVKAMDDVLEENLPNHPLEEQREMAKNYRNIGIGIMGFHDTLIKMGVTYGSDHSVVLAATLMEILLSNCINASSNLAHNRGKFPKYSSKIFDSTIFKELDFAASTCKKFKMYGLRNCSFLSIAPTGSVGTMLNISTGIEPHFMKSYTRRTESLNGQTEYHEVYVPVIKEALNRKWHPECLVTAQEINWRDRIDVQAALQGFCDTSISSTINLPNNTTEEEISDLFKYAWRQGLKGVTIFRDGCARLGVLTSTDKKDKEEKKEVELNQNFFNSITPVSRKTMGVTSGSTFCKKCACGTLYTTINRDNNGNIVEVFTHTSKGGICQANLNAETRMISLALRSGVKVDEIIDQLKGISCPACTAIKAKGEKVDGISCADIIAKTIMEFQNKDVEIKPVPQTKPEYKLSGPLEECPECHDKGLINTGGCVSCLNCGWSKCNL